MPYCNCNPCLIPSFNLTQGLRSDETKRQMCFIVHIFQVHSNWYKGQHIFGVILHVLIERTTEFICVSCNEILESLKALFTIWLWIFIKCEMTNFVKQKQRFEKQNQSFEKQKSVCNLPRNWCPLILSLCAQCFSNLYMGIEGRRFEWTNSILDTI